MTQSQKGVVFGIVAGGLIALTCFLIAVFWTGIPVAPSEPTAIIGLWLILSSTAVFWLFVCIARMAQHRFFSIEDIDAGASPNTSDRARILQSILQNTLEQSLLAIVTYGAWLFLGPAPWRMLPVLCAGLFSLGRILFIVGYSFGAPYRATGFALTFYPSVFLLITLLAAQAARLL
jgi:MAPEG family